MLGETVPSDLALDVRHLGEIGEKQNRNTPRRCIKGSGKILDACCVFDLSVRYIFAVVGRFVR